MNTATKTLATIMLVTMLTLSSVGVGAVSPNETLNDDRGTDRDTRQLDRLYSRHDRKMNIRASVLNIEPEELRVKLKSDTFDNVIKQAGFKTRQSFHTALLGKMKQELHARGWDDQRIQTFVQKRLDRYAKNHN